MELRPAHTHEKSTLRRPGITVIERAVDEIVKRIDPDGFYTLRCYKDVHLDKVRFEMSAPDGRRMTSTIDMDFIGESIEVATVISKMIHNFERPMTVDELKGATIFRDVGEKPGAKEDVFYWKKGGEVSVRKQSPCSPASAGEFVTPNSLQYETKNTTVRPLEPELMESEKPKPPKPSEWGSW